MTGGHCTALLVAVDPAVDRSQRQGHLQRDVVEVATAAGGRVSCSTYSASYAQVRAQASRSTPSPTSCTMRLVFAVNMVYALDRCGSSCAWPPKLKGSHCALTTKVPLFLRKLWRDIREYCCKAQKSHKIRGEECLKPTQQKLRGSP